MNATAAEQIEVLRRIAERGLRYGEAYKLTHVVDLFQHMINEIAVLKRELSQHAPL